ncbi:hypothetical protein BROOK1789C_1790 [Bathymodiolus brooksi thiotrophic gill symbiont]|nr:hypothetical protein BROOK1789C_1790 [Bathymodiolus brooksi thiotrophic gill symbiont]
MHPKNGLFAIIPFHCFSKICKYSVVLFVLLNRLLSALNL